MDKALGWIGEIFQTLMKLLPWLVIVPATHEGVAFVRGRHVRKWGPGLHWYWPVATQYKTIAVVRQTQLIQSKVVMTKDKQTVIAGALVTYFVDDVVSALAKIADLASDVMERSQGAIYEAIGKHTLEEIQSNRGAFREILTERVGESLNGYGVQIIQVQLTEFAPARALAINTRGAIGHHAMWTGF
ncbi:SPFH domain-containing protein [Rhodomicrobium sp. Az07]|uniref:SPFH domain-containing protein n=1 Tax=Rhodomicrobium sp. Az07 TaxID=2839034 RepID=UPI001BE78855|nr:SPFH domain-containing protein [Rhodomicrobium sp. Az07]MBT3069480.1 SPFH domain-containing protein [Rhodomicrobium sp. Az07]